MMSQVDYDQKLAEARTRVDAMDKIDGRKERSLSTMLAAMRTGVRKPETGAQFDAIVMLKDVIADPLPLGLRD